MRIYILAILMAFWLPFIRAQSDADPAQQLAQSILERFPVEDAVPTRNYLDNKGFEVKGVVMLSEDGVLQATLGLLSTKSRGFTCKLIFNLVDENGQDLLQVRSPSFAITGSGKVKKSFSYDQIPFEVLCKTHRIMSSVYPGEEGLRGTNATLAFDVKSALSQDLRGQDTDLTSLAAAYNDNLSLFPAFPYPPPRYSSIYEIPRSYFAEQDNLSEVNRTLNAALEKCGYLERSYYQAPNGFALVTRLEQIREDGTPMEDPQRWEINFKPLRTFSLKSFLHALLFEKKGYFRIIVFWVSNRPVYASEEHLSRSAGQSLLRGGINQLPPELSEIPFGQDYHVTALIYEFEQQEFDKSAIFREQSNLVGKVHLEKANIISALK